MQSGVSAVDKGDNCFVVSLFTGGQLRGLCPRRTRYIVKTRTMEKGGDSIQRKLFPSIGRAIPDSPKPEVEKRILFQPSRPFDFAGEWK